MLQDYYARASSFKHLLIKTGVLGGLLLITLYLGFRAYYINFTPTLVVFSLALFLAELHTIILMYGLLYSLWPRKYQTYLAPNLNRKLQINLIITCAGEPPEVVTQTISHALVATNYYNARIRPHKPARVIVLNDGKSRKKDGWQQIENFCSQNGVYHIARDTNEGFKAGNINHGLKQFPTTDPHNTVDCFLDSDFCAKEEFLTEITKPLVDNTVDFVQSPQRYQNTHTWVAQAAGAHQIFFFDYICPAKSYDNALFLCGTNYAIRRSALKAAGYVDTRFVTEDYATSIKLHLTGCKGVFIPNVLALGLAPMNLKEYFNQQTRWCKGCLDANGKYFRELFFGPLSWRQKFHYFLSTAYYFIGIRDLILVLAPVPYLFWGISLIRANTLGYLALIYLPLVIFNFTLFFITFRHPVKSLVLDIVAFPVFAVAFGSSILKRNLPFTITLKKYEKENPFSVYKIQLAIAAILSAGLVYSLLADTPANIYGRLINYFWAAYDVIFLIIGFCLVARENWSLSVRLPRFELPALPRPVYSLAIASISLIIMSVIGLAVPVVYDAAKHEYTKVTHEYKLSVPATGAYYGYYLPQLNFHPQEFSPKNALAANDSPTLIMYYQDWQPGTGFNSRLMNSISDAGAVPVITWEPDFPAPQSEIISGARDSYIRRYAAAAKAYRKPFFLRFAHEMNGNWYPWAGDAALYREMWIHVHNIFTKEGADNVLWVWSPNNTDQYGQTSGVLDYYPGDAYVDWTGFSGFNWGHTPRTKWQTFNVISYDIYHALSSLDNPVMVAETSSVSRGGNKTGWFYQALGTYIPQMPNIKAVVLFNQDYDNANFSLESDMDAAVMITDNLLNNPYYLKSPLLVYIPK